eukprot:gnl/TRDRNA2_/TRDRNA2_147469_c0_seq1.p1 gnl/TRDRNA2_/TRDRNA2_147469_c0~~gnl/TRDRNA2_/TRDRNA2_147469_c0_seq1.p1  ORF type:complete len:631 (+),score=84.23 gnl/TRDRNA2_/TRDRNA2_147469_c0_seq1:45-1937(+)
MDGVVESLRKCAELHGSSSAEVVLHQWQPDQPDFHVTDDFLRVVVFALATGAVAGPTLEEKQDALVGLERSLALAAQCLDAAAVANLTQSVVERTLRVLDATGNQLSMQATRQLLRPGTVVAELTEPLRAVLALLLRCCGIERFTVRELLDLTRRDVALAMAVMSEALGAAKPAGIPQWSAKMANMLHQMTNPDTCVWLLQKADPGRDFNSVPIAEIEAKELAHSQVVAFAFVQFELLDRALRAAEDTSVRQVIFTSLLKVVHNLVAGRGLLESGRLLSRCIALDFMRFGYRFLAPSVRRLIDSDERATGEAGRLLRHTCRTVSWLLAHAERDGSRLLADALRPLATEWTLRSLGRGASLDSVAVLLCVAANCGSLEEGTPLHVAAAQHVDTVRDAVEQEAWRPGSVVTETGRGCLLSLGFNIPEPLAEDGVNTGIYHDPDFGGDEDDEWWAQWWAENTDGEGAPAPEGGPDSPICSNCKAVSENGRCGEGTFDGLWYCQTCWDSWEDAIADKDMSRALLCPWWPDGWSTDTAEPGQQRGAAALLSRTPGHFRCGISGSLLTTAPVRVPGCAAAAHPVAFSRPSLERWHRCSGGRCPITLEPLQLASAEDAPDVLQELESWLNLEQGPSA